MADSFQDADLAAYYDLINRFGDDDRFYLSLVMAADAVDALPRETGFEVAERYGFWDRAPLTGTSREIITIARPGPPPAAGRR